MKWSQLVDSGYTGKVSFSGEGTDAKEISDNANEEKTLFLYNMTQEIRETTKNIDNEAEQLKSEVENIDTDSDWNPKKDKKWSKVPDDIKKLILSIK